MAAKDSSPFSYESPLPPKDLSFTIEEIHSLSRNDKSIIIIPFVPDPDKSWLSHIQKILGTKAKLSPLFEQKRFFRNGQNPHFFSLENQKTEELSHFLFVPLGERKQITSQTWLDSLISGLENAASLGYDDVAILLFYEIFPEDSPVLLAERIASAAALSRFHKRFLALQENQKNKQKEDKPALLKKVTLVPFPRLDGKSWPIKDMKQGLAEGKTLGKMVNHAREFVSLPANHLTPDSMWQRIKRLLANKSNITSKSFGLDQLRKMGLEGLVAIGQGSHNGARLIILEYRGAPKQKDYHLGLVGKGITFDSGGISLKPGQDMHEMKGDMGGSAATLFAFLAIAEQKLPINVVLALAVAENMPDGRAQRPGDVYKSYKGLTVEVLNTDAEGRLVMADALSYLTNKYNPEQLIDTATLTGAAVMALGNQLGALFSNDDDMREQLFQSGEVSLDRLWPMPLYPEYSQELKSDIADLANIGPRTGGAITAATFLSHFVPEKKKWAHLDIAPTFMSKKNRGLQRKGATGFGVRVLYYYAKALNKKR